MPLIPSVDPAKRRLRSVALRFAWRASKFQRVWVSGRLFRANSLGTLTAGPQKSS